jgi:hypothetical protein
MVGLLELSNTDLCHILKVLAYTVQEFTADVAFACKKTIQRVLFGCLFWKYVEFLQLCQSTIQINAREVSYRGKLAKPFATTFKQSSHPGWLLRSLRFHCSSSDQLVVVVCQHPHLPELSKKFITYRYGSEAVAMSKL